MTTTFVSNEEFLNNTQINSFLLDCEFNSAEDADEFLDSYDYESISFIITSYSELQIHLDDLEYYSVISNINDSNIISELGAFIIIPIFETWVFEEVTLDYNYQAGTLNINLSLEITNFPASTIKVLILQIDSIFEYNLEIVLE